jgi:acyl dehydratase
MPLNASAVGMTVKSEQLTVSARRVLAFAAIFPDVTAGELDDVAEEGLTACPYLCVTYEWIYTRLMRQADALGLAPDEARRGVHAGQDTTFHAALRAGATIRVEAQIEAVRPTRAGALMVARIRILDAATGEPCTTSRIEVILRGVGVAGQPSPPPPAPSEPASTAAVATVRIPIPRAFAHVYTECADIWNQIHTERRVALAAGLPDIIVHGSALWALAGREIVTAHGGGDSRRLARLACRFSAMVIPGTTVTLEHAPTNLPGGIGFVMRTETGEAALTRGIAELRPERSGPR